MKHRRHPWAELLKIFFLASLAKGKKNFLPYTPFFFFFSGVEYGKGPGEWEASLRPGIESSSVCPSSFTHGCKAEKGEGKVM